MQSAITKEQWPVKHLSASAIKKFNRCPYSFKARYILKLKEPRNEHLVLGGSIHASIDLQVKMSNKIKKNLPLDAILTHYQKETAKGAQELSGVSKEQLRRLYPVGHDLVEKLYFKMLELKPIGSEKRINYLDIGLPLPILGYIDLLFEDGFGETKTVSKWFTPADIDQMIQLTIYNEAYNTIYGRYPKIRIIEANKKLGDLRVSTVTRTQKHFEKLQIMVDEIVHALTRNEFPRCGKRNCWACNLGSSNVVQKVQAKV